MVCFDYILLKFDQIEFLFNYLGNHNYILYYNFTIAIRYWLTTDGDNLLALITGLLNAISWLFLAMFIIAQVSLSV